MDEASARFVCGEVAAALCSVHDAGFVFGDLKPENILITEAGHVKLTDFGGCRAATDEARTYLLEASKADLGAICDGRPAEVGSSSGGVVEQPAAAAEKATPPSFTPSDGPNPKVVEDMEFKIKGVVTGKYSGSVNAANQPHGRGTFRADAGDVYEGGWKDGKKHGQAVHKCSLD